MYISMRDKPKLVEGDWLYLIEDSADNLKLGFSSDLYRRLYAYRNAADQTRHFPFPTPNCSFWLLGVRPGKRQEEMEFHKGHANECVPGFNEWYPFASRAAALLLLQNWQEPMHAILGPQTMAPHYSLVHRKTTSDLASLLSRSRINKRGTPIVLHPCPHCSVKYSARTLRQHQYVCEMRPNGKPKAQRADWPSGEFGECSLSYDGDSARFHQTSTHCPVCGVRVCVNHRGEHNRRVHGATVRRKRNA